MLPSLLATPLRTDPDPDPEVERDGDEGGTWSVGHLIWRWMTAETGCEGMWM